MKTFEYEESFGTVTFPEGFAQRLEGRSLEEQMRCFRTTSYRSCANTGFAARTSRSGYRTLDQDPDLRGLIVKDQMIVGVMIADDCGRTVPCLPEERVCTYYACDNNGAGYKERIDYTWLLCVPADFEGSNSI